MWGKSMGIAQRSRRMPTWNSYLSSLQTAQNGTDFREDSEGRAVGAVGMIADEEQVL